MIKVFRVYQNHSNIASYFNKWMCDKNASIVDDIPDFESIPVSDGIIDISDRNFHSSDRVFVYRLSIDDDRLLLFARYSTESGSENINKTANNIMNDIAKYIKLNYKNEIISGNLTRLLTQFLANYFKKFEDIAQKKRKISTLKQGLVNVQEIATQTFMTIVERGKAIGELQTEMDTISHHGYVFNTRTKRLKDKMWTQNLKTYLYAVAILSVIIIILYKII